MTDVDDLGILLSFVVLGYAAHLLPGAWVRWCYAMSAFLFVLGDARI